MCFVGADWLDGRATPAGLRASWEQTGLAAGPLRRIYRVPGDLPARLSSHCGRFWVFRHQPRMVNLTVQAGSYSISS